MSMEFDNDCLFLKESNISGTSKKNGQPYSLNFVHLLVNGEELKVKRDDKFECSSLKMLDKCRAHFKLSVSNNYTNLEVLNVSKQK